MPALLERIFTINQKELSLAEFPERRHEVMGIKHTVMWNMCLKQPIWVFQEGSFLGIGQITFRSKKMSSLSTGQGCCLSMCTVMFFNFLGLPHPATTNRTPYATQRFFFFLTVVEARSPRSRWTSWFGLSWDLSLWLADNPSLSFVCSYLWYPLGVFKSPPCISTELGLTLVASF